MFQTKVVEKNKTHILCSVTFFSSKIVPFMRKCGEKNIYCRAGQATDYRVIRRMRFACWITKATDRHSEYAIFMAFPRQEWSHERATMLLRHTDIGLCRCNLQRQSSGIAGCSRVFMWR